MQSNNDITVKGAIKIEGLLETACFTSFDDFARRYPQFLTIQLPATITNVIVSNVQPLDSQKDYIWFRRNNSGGFVGAYVFSQGFWRQVFPVPQGIFKLYGDSRDIPAGYILADNTNPNITTAMYNFLKTQWLRDPLDLYWMIFEVTYAGF